MAKVGRPSKYEGQKTIDQAVKLCRRFGADDKQLAEFFEVNPDTISEWKYTYPDFSVSTREAKFEYDTDNIEVALRKRAEGFTQRVQQVTKDGIVEVDQYFPPDPSCIRYWTANRRRPEWKDRQDIEHSGSVDIAPQIVMKVPEPKK